MTEHVHDWRGGWFCGGADGCGAQHEASPWAFDGLEQASCNNVTAKINRRQNVNPGNVVTTDGVVAQMPHALWEAVKERQAELEAALTTIRDLLPLVQDKYSRRVFEIAADATEPSREEPHP